MFRGVVIVVAHRTVPAGVAHQERDGDLGVFFQIEVARRAILRRAGLRSVENLVGGVVELLPVLLAQFVARIGVVDAAVGVVVSPEPRLPAVAGDGCRLVTGAGSFRCGGGFGLDGRSRQRRTVLVGGQQRPGVDVGGVDIGFGEIGREVDLCRETALCIGVARIKRLDTFDFFIRRAFGVLPYGCGIVDFEVYFGLRAVIHRKGGSFYRREVEFVELLPGFCRTVVRNVLDTTAQQCQRQKCIDCSFHICLHVWCCSARPPLG